MAQNRYNPVPSYDQGNPYGQQAANPYGQQSRNPYGQQAPNPYNQRNPYDERGGNPYGSQAGNPYNQQPGGPYAGQQQQPQSRAYGVGPQDVEMGLMDSDDKLDPNDPFYLTKKAQNIEKDLVQRIENEKLIEIKRLRQQILDDPNASANTTTRDEYKNLDADILTAYQGYTERLGRIMKTPGAGNNNNSAQLGRIKRKLEASLNKYRGEEQEYIKKLEEQARRQLKTINPDITETEIREAIETGQTQHFQQQLLQSNRQGQARAIQKNVEGRHLEIQRINQQMQELLILFTQVSELVAIQEVQIERVDEQAAQTTQHLKAGGDQLESGVQSARAARRKKWWCLGIAVAILIVIAIILAIIFGYVIPHNNANNNSS